MLKSRKQALLGIAIVLLAGYALLAFALPAWWSGPCGNGCRRSLKAVMVSPWGLTLYGFSLEEGDPEVERWELSARRIELVPIWSELMSGRFSVRSFSADGLRVSLTEGDSPKKEKGAPLPEFRVGKARAEAARFTYERRHKGRIGRLSFADIALHAGALGTDPSLANEATQVKLSALMEQSGHVSVKLRARFFAHDPRLDLSLNVKGLKLAEANAYFKPIDDIELKGSLNEAAAELRGSHEKVQASVALRFKNFGVDFHGGRERSGFAAFLGDALGGALFAEDSGQGKTYRPGYATITREPGESPVGFVLRGLKEAAMEAARH